MKVLITRPRSQADSFANALAEIGFEPVYFPVIEIRPFEHNAELDQALKNLNKYDWVVFTSANAVDVVFDVIARRVPFPTKQSPIEARRLLRSARSDIGPNIAAIGPKTAAALRSRGVTPDFVPEEYVAEAILPGLGDLRGKWVLLPRAEIARKALPKAIAEAGGVAHEIAVYQTVPAQLDSDGLAALRSGVDVVTFTSPSTVEHFVEIARRAGLDPFHLPGNPKIACIGPITQKAAEEAGFVDLVTAEVYTTEGLIKLLRSGA